MLPVLILYIDRDYHITYWILGEQVKIVSPLSLTQAIQLLKNIEFDLIVSDPLHIAVLRAHPPDKAAAEGAVPPPSVAHRPLSEDG